MRGYSATGAFMEHFEQQTNYYANTSALGNDQAYIDAENARDAAEMEAALAQLKQSSTSTMTPPLLPQQSPQ